MSKLTEDDMSFNPLDRGFLILTGPWAIKEGNIVTVFQSPR